MQFSQQAWKIMSLCYTCYVKLQKLLCIIDKLKEKICEFNEAQTTKKKNTFFIEPKCIKYIVIYAVCRLNIICHMFRCGEQIVLK